MIDDQELRTFRRTHISRRDFEKAEKFVAAARRLPADTIEHEALLLAAIIHYARPFSPNEKGSDPPADSRLDAALAEFEDKDDSELHANIIRLRNKAVAHSEFAQNQVQLATRPQRGKPSIGAVVYTTWDVRQESLDLSRFQRIATEMRARCVIAGHASLAR